MATEKQNAPFLFLTEDGKGMYYVFLVNPTDTKYIKVKKLTGSFTSMGDDLIETGKAVFDLPALQPHSHIQIDNIDWRERDFTIWYQLDLTSEENTRIYLKGSVPKRIVSNKEFVAYGVDQEGWVLDLLQRPENIDIDETIKTMNMNSRYITFNDDGSIKESVE